MSHSSSWTPAAYEYEYFDDGLKWRRLWSQSRYFYWFLDQDGDWLGPMMKGPSGWGCT